MGDDEAFLVVNDGEEIVETSYWESAHGKKGLVCATCNAGAIRLLIPPASGGWILDMVTGVSFVVMTKGMFQRQPAVEFMFEDDSDTPFHIIVTEEMFDRRLGPADYGKKVKVAIWVKEGKIAEYPALLRGGDALPYLKAVSPMERKLLLD